MRSIKEWKPYLYDLLKYLGRRHLNKMNVYIIKYKTNLTSPQWHSIR